MKKILLTICASGLFCAAASAQDGLTPVGTTPMPVVADLGGAILRPDGSIFTVYPAEVTLEGQWCDIALWKGPFSITEYPSFRVVLQRGTEDDNLVQIFARNRESGQNYSGPYIPFKKNQTVLEGDFADYTNDEYQGHWFDDDPICTWFALQKTNKGSETRTVTVVEAVLINEDGDEVKSCNVRNGSWKPAPGWVEPDPLMEADVQFTSKGIVGLYDATIIPGTLHRFTFNTREPLPEGFTFYVVLNDGDDTTYDYPVPAGVTSYTTPDIDDDYLRAYLEYEGDYPMTVHFTSIIRDVVDPAGISSAVSMTGVEQRDVFSPSGMQRSWRQAHGLSIVRDRMADGSVRVKKVIK